jgi:hypothetical protein
MNEVIDENGYCRKFNYSSLISDDEDKKICEIVKAIIESGNYFKNSPKFQTQENVFSRPEPIWVKLRMTFLTSIFLYLGREVKVSNMNAWSFMTNLNGAEDRDNLWHNHLPDTNKKKLSGIYYAHIPDDVTDLDTCGTEFAPNGPESPERFFVRPTKKTWLIYPSQKWHRPGIVQSNKNRFIVAVDIEVEI